MNVNEMTFGVEIETTIPRGTLIVGPHGNGADIPALPGWKADRDPSIRAGAGFEACEFVSPVFKGVEGARQLLADITKIKAMGARVNSSCGIHIHVGADRTDRELMERLTTLIANFETAIFASTGTKNRERGRWCNGLRRHGEASRAIAQASSYRYHVVNLGSAKPTVEFRAFSASLNPHKIVSWVSMALAIVQRAATAKRATNWTAKPVSATSPIHRSGEGQTALTRLFYQLGWIKGRQPFTFGDLTGDQLPTIKTIKKTLMKLARKYDAQA